MKVKNHEHRLCHIRDFLKYICIEANGYDLKQIINKLIYGEYDLNDALDEWQKLGWSLFIKREDLIVEEVEE